VRGGPPHLDLGTVDPQLDTFGCGVGEHILQGAQPYGGVAGDGEPAPLQQRPDLMDGAGDGRPVHVVEHGQGSVRELERMMTSVTMTRSTNGNR
jgi:hypothetical protein